MGWVWSCAALQGPAGGAGLSPWSETSQGEAAGTVFKHARGGCTEEGHSLFSISLGDRTKSWGERSQLDTKKTHPRGMMRPGACLRVLGHPWGSSEDSNEDKNLRSAHHSSR